MESNRRPSQKPDIYYWSLLRPASKKHEPAAEDRLAEELQVDRLAHGLIAGVARVQVVT